MAGLDDRRASDFLGVLRELAGTGDARAPVDPQLLCEEALRTIRMVSDTLLLRGRDQKLSDQTFGGCCDTLIAKSKTVSIDFDHVVTDLRQRNNEALCKHIASLTEGVTVLIETAAHSVFLVSDGHAGSTKGHASALDLYPVQRAKLAVTLALDAFERNPTKEQTMASAAVVATHLEVLREECTKAADRSGEASVMFKAVTRGLTGAATMLVAALKEHIRLQSDRTRKACVYFGAPVISSIDALILFAEDEELTGKAPFATRDVTKYLKPLQAAALSLSSSFNLFVGLVKKCVVEPRPINTEAQLERYSQGVNEAVTSLVSATRDIRKAQLIADR